MRLFLLLLAFSLCIPRSVHGQKTDEYRLSRLEFRGVEQLDRRELLSVMRTKRPTFLAILPFVRDPVLDESVLNDDRGTIVRLYQNRGYYDAEVRIETRLNEEDRTAAVTVIVREGRPSLLRDIDIRPGTALPGVLMNGIRAAVALEAGKPFEFDAYGASKDSITEYLGNNGYPSTAVDGRVTVYKELRKVDVLFDITPGTFTYFGPVSITGNESVDTGDITAELAFREGYPFSWARIYQTQRNILQTGLFRSVLLTPEFSGNAEAAVQVQVQEREKRSVELGIGYGNEDRLRFRASWLRRYLFGAPRTLAFNFRYSSIMESAAVTITQLYFLDHFSNVSADLEYDREFLPSFSNERVSSVLRVGRSFSRTFNGFAAYLLELNRPVSVNPTVARYLRESNPESYYLISGFRAGLTYDTTFSVLNPRRGGVYSVSIEPSSHIFGSGLDYLRGVVDARKYGVLTDDIVLAARTMFGFIKPYRFTKDIPLFKRFYAGGSDSIRGYGFQAVGPQDGNGNPVGGQYLVLGNLEARHPLYRSLRGVVFIDGGNVFLSALDLRLQELKFGTGVGLRYETPAGPARLDIAFPFTPSTNIKIAEYKLYFSIGQAF